LRVSQAAFGLLALLNSATAAAAPLLGGAFA
jgi:hypothetical protein